MSLNRISAKFMQAQDIFWSRLRMRQLLMKPPAWTDMRQSTRSVAKSVRVQSTAITRFTTFTRLTVKQTTITVLKSVEIRNEMIDQQFEESGPNVILKKILLL